MNSAVRHDKYKPSNLEEDFLKRFLYLGLASAVLISTFDIFITQSLIFASMDVAFVLIFVFFIYLMKRISADILSTILIIVLGANITFQFFMADGWNVEIMSTIFIAFGIYGSIAILHNILRRVAVISIFLMMFFIWSDSIFLSSPIIGIESSYAEFKKFLPFALIFWTLAVPISMLKRKYLLQQKSLKQAHDDLQKKNKVIDAQHKDLLSNHESLLVLNKSLEDKVNAKSGDIIKQNKRLSEYAFAHAHIVRGHTARLSGLFNLMEMDPSSKNDYWNKIKAEVDEMNITIQELGEILYAED